MSPCGLDLHPHFIAAPDAHLTISLYKITGISPCFPSLDWLQTDPLSQARHTWSPQTFPSSLSYVFPELLFCNSNGQGAFSFTWTVCIIKYRKKWRCSNHSLIHILYALGHPFPNRTVTVCKLYLTVGWKTKLSVAEYKSRVDSPKGLLLCFLPFLFKYNRSAECVNGFWPRYFLVRSCPDVVHEDTFWLDF